MRLWIAASACALALGLVAPIGHQAEADGLYAPVRYRAAAPVAVPFTRKLCTAQSRRGGPVTWVCSASQKCCWDWLMRRGTCTDRCF